MSCTKHFGIHSVKWTMDKRCKMMYEIRCRYVRVPSYGYNLYTTKAIAWHFCKGIWFFLCSSVMQLTHQIVYYRSINWTICSYTYAMYITLTKRYHTFGTISGQLLRDYYYALNSYSIINITFLETSCIIRLLPLTNELRS